MQIPIVNNNQPIDYELAELLGEKPADFLVLCFDGVPLDFFGTPFDTPINRVSRQGLVDKLNDSSAESLWPDMWISWSPQIKKQFKLPENATCTDFRPRVSLIVSRVVAGYSKHFNVAAGLLEKITDMTGVWVVRASQDGGKKACSVTIVSRAEAFFSEEGEDFPKVIATAACRFLKAKTNKPINKKQKNAKY